MKMDGILVGIATFCLIGIFHVIIIQAEYYLSKKIWPAFLVAGILCIVLSTSAAHVEGRCLLAILGFTLLWSIKELFEQERRVEKGWFPRNEKRRHKPSDAQKVHCEKTLRP